MSEPKHSPRSVWQSVRSLLAPPAFADGEQAQRARMFHSVGVSTLLLITIVIPLVTLAQPDTLRRGVMVILVVDSLAVVTLALNHRGRTRLASWLYVGVILALLTFNASSAGGIRSPGVQAYFIFVMIAGLLLGERVGFLTALACAVLGLGLVSLELLGVLPPQKYVYGPGALWLLTCVYIGVALFAMRLATRAVQDALRRAQAELADRRAAQRRLAQALESGAIGVFDHDMRAGHFRGDDRALALTGLRPREDGTVPYDAWWQIVHPEDRPRVQASMTEFASGLPHGRTHYRIHRADGAERHMEAAAFLALDEQGRPASLVGMIMDVTDRKAAEQERERLLRALGERVKELRLLHDAAQLLREHEEVDRGVLAELVARMPAAWLQAQDCQARIAYRDIEVASPGWRASPWRQAAAFSASGAPGLVEVAYLTEHPPADEGPFLAEERALIDSLAEMLRSHIEQRASERQRRGLESQLRQAQKMDALGRLAGGIAHDFNNILTAIGGNAELARADAPPEGPVTEGLDEIIKAQGRARDLVKRILLFSRRQESEHKVMSLSPVVDEALKLLRATLPSSIQIQHSVAPGIPQVSADSTQIHQIVMNLGTNAGYAMKEAGGILSVGIDTVTVGDLATAPSADLEPGLHVRIAVRDTGTGMSAEVRERLFEPFFTTKGHAGTGLGLSVVHGIVREHGGAITVESEPGAGTEFRIYLPAVTEAAAQAKTEEPGIVMGRGQHIMYVDDEAALALVMSRTLKRLGYRCTGFTDPIAALQEFRTTPHAFDAVVTDLQMPAMSGLDLAHGMLQARPRVPVAVTSGYRSDEVDVGKGSGIAAWISKPATLAELSRALHDMLRNGTA